MVSSLQFLFFGHITVPCLIDWFIYFRCDGFFNSATIPLVLAILLFLDWLIDLLIILCVKVSLIQDNSSFLAMLLFLGWLIDWLIYFRCDGFFNSATIPLFWPCYCSLVDWFIDSSIYFRCDGFFNSATIPLFLTMLLFLGPSVLLLSDVSILSLFCIFRRN